MLGLEHHIYLARMSCFTGVICFGLSFLLIQANPRSKSCRLSALFTLFVGCFAFSYAGILTLDGPIGVFAAQLVNFNTLLLSVFLTHFVIVETGRESVSKRFLQWNYGVAILLIIINFTPGLTIAGIASKAGLPRFSDPGPLYWMPCLQLFINLIYSIILLVEAIKPASGSRRHQLCLFLVAVVIGYAAGTPSYLTVYDVPWKPIFQPLVVFYPILMTIAIVKHRFLDIGKLIKNTLIFTLLFFVLLAAVSVALFILKEVVNKWIGMPDAVAQAIAIAIAIGLYGPLKRLLSHITNTFLFHRSDDPEVIFRKLSQHILQHIDISDLSDEITQRVAKILALHQIGFYVRSRKNPSFFELKSKIGRFDKSTIHGTKQLVQYLQRTNDSLIDRQSPSEINALTKEKKPFVLVNLKEIKRVAITELADLDGVAAFPVFLKDDLRAFLVVGRKKSDIPWREEEFKILKSFCRHLTIALSNAECAEDIKHTREKLALSERDALAGALIAGIDHEVKNPLHTMLSCLWTLNKRFSDSKFMEGPRETILKTIQDTMESTLEDLEKVNGIIVHLSNLAKKKPLSLENNINLDEISNKIHAEFVARNQFKNVRVTLDVPENLQVTGDRKALYEIFTNLIRNGLQAISGYGELRVSGQIKHGGTLIEVEDTGSGMHFKQLDHIFKPFYTTKKTDNDSLYSGSGMGLFIVKELTQAMGATIDVKSELGKGTTFQLYFPDLDSNPLAAA